MTKKAKQEEQAVVATETVVVERTAEQQAQDIKDDDAAFAAGFDGAHGDAPAPEVPAKDVAEEQQPDPAAAAQDAPAAPASEDADAELPVLAGLKESEIKALLAKVGELTDYREKTEKTLQQIFGKFGDIQRQITAGGSVLSKREINAEALKQLNAEYPEIAGLLAGDLGTLLSATPSAGPQITQEQVDAHIKQSVTEQVTAAVDGVNEQMLSRFHKDWEDVAKSDDLKLWLGTQTPEYRGQFLESRKAAFISDGLDKFKAWREQSQGTRQNNQRRLEAAIPVRRGGGQPGPSALSDEAAFEQGYNKTRRSG